MLIVDEVSMLGRRKLSALNRHLKPTKDERELPFGGVLMVFRGDLFQIPPVASELVYEPVYEHPELQEPCTTALDLEGYKIWQELSYVVILEEIMCQIDYQAFSERLDNIRRGVYRGPDLEMLNKRVMRPDILEELLQCINGIATTVVSGNELRQALNWKSIKKMATNLGVLPVVWVAEMKPSHTERFLSRDLDVLMRAVDTETNNLASILPMLPGMPVRMTQNVALELCMENGTDGVLAGLKFARGTKFLKTKCFGVTCLVPTKLASLACVTVPKRSGMMPRSFKSVSNEIPNNTIPVLPFQSPSFAAAIKRKKTAPCWKNNVDETAPTRTSIHSDHM